MASTPREQTSTNTVDLNKVNSLTLPLRVPQHFDNKWSASLARDPRFVVAVRELAKYQIVGGVRTAGWEISGVVWEHSQSLHTITLPFSCSKHIRCSFEPKIGLTLNDTQTVHRVTLLGL